jgi:sucrose-6-phosphate hydrolase SacC (GH32 family)
MLTRLLLRCRDSGSSWWWPTEPDGKTLIAKAYNATLSWTDGKTKVMAQREEPKVLLGSDGQPTHLINVCTKPSITHSFVCIQPIAKRSSVAPLRTDDDIEQKHHDTDDPHRPVYHITPLEPGMKDPNGLFHDPKTGLYHVFHQMDWNHYISRDLVTWRRLDRLSEHVDGHRPYLCSGGGTIAPDASPLLLFCQGATLVPSNSSQAPEYRDWRPGGSVKQSCLGPHDRVAGDLPTYKNCSNDPVNPTNPYLPLNVPGLWDGSIWKDPLTGKYRATFGSCAMLNGTKRPFGKKNFCDGNYPNTPVHPPWVLGSQDGIPQIVAFESTDLKSWSFLGVPWQAPTHKQDRPWGPRIECPYTVTGLGPDGNRSVLLMGAAGPNQNYYLVGTFEGSNGSKFTGIGGSAGPGVDAAGHAIPGVDTFGSSIDAVEGLMYASAVMQRWGGQPPLLFSWVRGMCLINASEISKYNASWSGKDSSAMSLPKVMAVDEHDRLKLDVAPELKELRIGPPSVIKERVLPGGTAHSPSILAVPLPVGATGDAVELAINISCGVHTTSGGDATLAIALRTNGSVSTGHSFAEWEGAIATFGLDAPNRMSLATRSDPSFKCYGANPMSDHSPQVRAPLLMDDSGLCRLRIFVDHSILSVSVNEGLRTLTARVYPSKPDEAVGVFLLNMGTAPIPLSSVQLWGMRSIWGAAARKTDDFDAVAAFTEATAAYSPTKCGLGEKSMVTEYGAEVLKDCAGGSCTPLPEYPRPTMTRPSFHVLNGLWQWEPARLDNPAAPGPGTAPVGKTLNGSILVPFPVESCLSGVPLALQRVQLKAMWYRLVFDAPTAEMAAAGSVSRLHFGAVDWMSAVFLNGAKLGENTGGYSSFSFTPSGALKPTGNELLVWVYDPSDAGPQPMGKQRVGSIAGPSGDRYTPTSGIWQTCWLEPVPTEHILALRSRADLTHFHLLVNTSTPGAAFTVAVDLSPHSHVNGTSVEAYGVAGQLLSVAIPAPRRLWSTAAPNLYNFTVTLTSSRSSVQDSVRGYFGMRTFRLGTVNGSATRRPLLNGNYTFAAGWLDQSWWPDGQCE